LDLAAYAMRHSIHSTMPRSGIRRTASYGDIYLSLPMFVNKIYAAGN